MASRSACQLRACLSAPLWEAEDVVEHPCPSCGKDFEAVWQVAIGAPADYTPVLGGSVVLDYGRCDTCHSDYERTDELAGDPLVDPLAAVADSAPVLEDQRAGRISGTGTSTPGTMGRIRQRAVLLSIWRLTPSPEVRRAIEVELYGTPDSYRAREEAERLAGLTSPPEA